MSFSWLPDAELDPHPRLTWLAECGFDLTVRALYRKEEMLPPDYRLEPGTLVVSNHQRDADVPVLTTALCQRRGLHIRWPLTFFASREDFFERGFLAGLLYTWPRPLRGLLGGVSLGWFFRIVRCQPMRRVREYTLADAWRDLPHDSSHERPLNARGRREADAARTQVGRTKDFDKRFWGLRRLQAEARAALYPDFHATINAQLEHFAALLDAGRVVYFAPEGTISDEGRFGRMRAGVRRLVRLTTTPPPLLPAALSYDALGPGRLRVIVRVGTPWVGYDAEDAAGFNAMMEMAIRRLYPVNTSHLIARFLTCGPERFAAEALADWIGTARGQLAAAGCTLDPTLEQADVTALASERLHWLQRQGLIRRVGSGWKNEWPRASSPGWRRPVERVPYFDNALDDHLHALAPELELRP